MGISFGYFWSRLSRAFRKEKKFRFGSISKFSAAKMSFLNFILAESKSWRRFRRGDFVDCRDAASRKIEANAWEKTKGEQRRKKIKGKGGADGLESFVVFLIDEERDKGRKKKDERKESTACLSIKDRVLL